MASTPACSLPRCQTALLAHVVDLRACDQASCAFCAPPRCSGAPLPRARAKRSSRLAGAQAATPLGRRRPIAPALRRDRQSCARGSRKVESQPEGDLSTRNQEAGGVVPSSRGFMAVRGDGVSLASWSNAQEAWWPSSGELRLLGEGARRGTSQVAVRWLLVGGWGSGIWLRDGVRTPWGSWGGRYGGGMHVGAVNVRWGIRDGQLNGDGRIANVFV